MLSPDGTVMCLCAYKKMKWYVSRGLAKELPYKPKTFQLIFNPKGLGHSDNRKNQQLNTYFLSPKHNRCCVCSSREKLTRHHCVPTMYRKNFPENAKSHNSHDVVILCQKCHGREVVEKIEYEALVIRWRTHFIETMKPKFMPKGWDINNPAHLLRHDDI